MRKLLTTSITTLAASILLLANAQAQQTPAAATPPAPAAQAPKTPVAKTGQTAKPRTTVPLTLKTPKDKFSYALGMNLGTGLHKQSVDVDPAILLRGLRDALAGGKMLLTEEQAQAALVQVQNDLRKKQQEKMQQAALDNKKAGDTFLAANKAQDGVVTLPSGLQYKVLKEGAGPKPAATDSVVCNYSGTLLDGTEFDSSYKRGQPATFQVNGVIKGWTEALQLMPVGSKWQLVIPAELAYGDRGAGPQIGPNATLVFEVELLSIQPKAAATTPAPTADTPH
jgi:FKBP-type peptidyl-prolyl cis-trans isomerase FklB